MNDDSEALQRQVLRLLQKILSQASLADANAIAQELGHATIGDESLDPNLFQFLEELDSEALSRYEPGPSIGEKSSLEFGELPTVQDRFYALLKRRLESEIQQRPELPRFPWETDVRDYEDIGVTQPADQPTRKVPALVWLNHLRALSLPVAVPDEILMQVFQRCQEMLHSSLMDGVKLVKAVEELFPGEERVLNHLAGLVMTSPARSGAAVAADGNYPVSYEQSAPAQQMVLSLLAAREIVGSLTLAVSAQQPVSDRQWLTDLGELTLRVEADFADPSKLRIQANLPGAGRLVLAGREQQAVAERATAGTLSVELIPLQAQQPYALTVQLTDADAASLNFAVRVTDT